MTEDILGMRIVVWRGASLLRRAFWPTLLALSLVASLSACTARNPSKCLNGTCSDERFPYCDEDGSVGGNPGSCIAVSCTPDAFETCSGDREIRCNDDGSNFQTAECMLGCAAEASGCRQCTENTQCTGTLPICDEDSSSCRACALDDECPSRVCDKDTGACVAESAVIYASPTGNGSLCSQLRPCLLATALMAAQTASPVIRLLPGTYTTAIDIGYALQPIRIIATGSTITVAGTDPALIVHDGADVDVRGLTIVAMRALRCGTPTGALSKAKLRDATITVLGNESPVLGVNRCAVSLAHADVSLGDSEIVIDLLDDSSMLADRVHLHGNKSHHIISFGSRVNFTLTNSLLVDIGFDLSTTDTGAPGSKFTIAHDTLVYTVFYALGQGCGLVSNYLDVRYENSILAPLGAFDAIYGPNNSCRFTNTLMTRESIPFSGAIIADPRFVAPVTRDFHLQASSPAVDAAAASSVGTQADLDGRARPVGAASDVGAYEYSP
jgi:hypothetical protein